MVVIEPPDLRCKPRPGSCEGDPDKMGDRELAVCIADLGDVHNDCFNTAELYRAWRERMAELSQGK